MSMLLVVKPLLNHSLGKQLSYNVISHSSFHLRNLSLVVVWAAAPCIVSIITTSIRHTKKKVYFTVGDFNC